MKVKNVVIGVVGGVAVLTAAAFFGGSAGMSEVKSLVINDIDMSKVNDGTYEGTYQKKRWNYDLSITIKDKKITEIQFSNQSTAGLKGFNQKAVEAVIQKQSPRIDVVAGASVHTKAFSKAVENALSKALSQ